MDRPEAWGLLEFAQADLRAARVDQQAGLYSHACIQSQQAADKALKALLAASQQRIPHVHDLELLAQTARQEAPTLPPFDEAVDRLNQYGSAARYDPTLLTAVDAAEASDAVSHAASVVEWATGYLSHRQG